MSLLNKTEKSKPLKSETILNKTTQSKTLQNETTLNKTTQSKTLLIKNIDVITAAKPSVIMNTNIGIKGDKIAFISDDEKVISEFKADRVIDGKHRLAMPGLVNTHTHSAMTLLRNYANDLSLQDWLFNKILPVEATLNADDVYWGTKLGIVEMLKSGVTCFADMYLHMDMVAQAILESGIKANICRNPLKSPDVNTPSQHIGDPKYFEYFWKWNGQGNGRLKVYVEVHSTYLYDERSLKEAAELAKNFSTGIHIHILETRTEIEQCKAMYGQSSVHVCERTGIFDVPVIAAHCVHLTEEEMGILAKYKVNVAHNPTSNLKLGSGIANVPAMLKKGINVCLGTDGTASNNNLNMFEEMHLAALLHKGVHMDPLLLDVETVFKMATHNGAVAAGFEDTGSLQPDMKADIILVDTDKAHMSPLGNPLSAIIYSAQAADVNTVIVDGEILMENRKLIKMDEEKIKFEVRNIEKKFYLS